MAGKGPQILVVALDAGLREETFDRLAAAGYRVDGVADLPSARKRLHKDCYALLVVEEGLGELAGSPDTPRLEVSPELLAEPGSLEARVRDAVRAGLEDD